MPRVTCTIIAEGIGLEIETRMGFCLEEGMMNVDDLVEKERKRR